MKLKHIRGRLLDKFNLLEFWFAILLASLPLPFGFQNVLFAGFVLTIIYKELSFISRTAKIRLYHLLCYLLFLLIIISTIWSIDKSITIDKVALRFLNFILIPSVFLIWKRRKGSTDIILRMF